MGGTLLPVRGCLGVSPVHPPTRPGKAFHLKASLSWFTDCSVNILIFFDLAGELLSSSLEIQKREKREDFMFGKKLDLPSTVGRLVACKPWFVC